MSDFNFCLQLQIVLLDRLRLVVYFVSCFHFFLFPSIFLIEVTILSHVCFLSFYHFLFKRSSTSVCTALAKEEAEKTLEKPQNYQDNGVDLEFCVINYLLKQFKLAVKSTYNGAHNHRANKQIILLVHKIFDEQSNKQLSSMSSIFV